MANRDRHELAPDRLQSRGLLAVAVAAESRIEIFDPVLRVPQVLGEILVPERINMLGLRPPDVALAERIVLALFPLRLNARIVGADVVATCRMLEDAERVGKLSDDVPVGRLGNVQTAVDDTAFARLVNGVVP